ncbi:hypothetical protein DPMN_058699 [Dreissena polymorpha]|uniref:Uncharacterized protein n=1 Tax=Dreissena polymorpha TaxID=45954 RepID=A0A9D4HFR9_DREPO|nr:hypothetical protein DPMN_058699 [Dreissena polymorpha]
MKASRSYWQQGIPVIPAARQPGHTGSKACRSYWQQGIPVILEARHTGHTGSTEFSKRF